MTHTIRREPWVLIVPGLRDHIEQHWQTLLEARLRAARRPVAAVAPMGRADLDCAARVDAIEAAVRSCVRASAAPVVIVAHSAGCLSVAHWARRYPRTASEAIRGALLAVPPDFDTPMPEGYPQADALAAASWLPVPREALPFASIVAASGNDPLARHAWVGSIARDWGSECVELGDVGHLNPASGHGEWPAAEGLIEVLARPGAL
ncbi:MULTISPECIES: RBBP9/YdeN family alpha/beta hydrolase [unclassified Paraburkholderia]|uniref:RBBP9/YdeN family alpha/beta hydrolase n=1 Tax=unclassified Paraburkholderia TaxID=2615204 RepID=UPI002AB1B617|nr:MULTISPECIES: alpha/beta hydrolase [unclassified Paraburkholderia]